MFLPGLHYKVLHTPRAISSSLTLLQVQPSPCCDLNSTAHAQSDLFLSALSSFACTKMFGPHSFFPWVCRCRDYASIDASSKRFPALNAPYLHPLEPAVLPGQGQRVCLPLSLWGPFSQFPSWGPQPLSGQKGVMPHPGTSRRDGDSILWRDRCYTGDHTLLYGFHTGYEEKQRSWLERDRHSL